MTTVVLFGAGASRGSNHVMPSPPPLGGELFRELRTTFPGSWGAMPTDLDAVFAEDFEAGMLRLSESHSHAIPPLMKDMTLYFASFTTDGSGQDVYSELLAAIPREGRSRVLLSTLNYECLLELAASRQGLQVEYGEAPVRASGVRIWKLHGSCNFIPDPNEIQVSGQGVSYSGMGVEFNARLLTVDPAQAAQWVRGNTGLYAAMCLFMVGKPIQIGKPQVSALQAAWQDRVAAAARVIVIGTRFHPQDRHLWDALGSTAAQVYFVGSRSSLEEWRPKRQPRPLVHVGSRIGEVIEDVKTLLAGT